MTEESVRVASRLNEQAGDLYLGSIDSIGQIVGYGGRYSCPGDIANAKRSRR